MNKKGVFIGCVLVLIGLWFYFALSSFEVEKHSFPKRLIIKKGIVRTEDEVAQTLSEEIGFDLEGAYKTGYTPADVIDYLIKEPHSYSVTLYNGAYYEGRRTIPRIFPLAVCIGLIIAGAGMILFNFKSRNT